MSNEDIKSIGWDLALSPNINDQAVVIVQKKVSKPKRKNTNSKRCVKTEDWVEQCSGDKYVKATKKGSGY